MSEEGTGAPAAPVVSTETPTAPAQAAEVVAVVPEVTPAPTATAETLDPVKLKADFDRQIAELRRENAGHRARNTDLDGKLKEFERAKLTEDERIKQEREEARAEAQAAREEAKAARIETLAIRAGAADPSDVIAILNARGLKEGQSLEDGIQAILLEKPYLKASAPVAAPPVAPETPAAPAAPTVPVAPATSPTNPARSGAAPTAVTTSQISTFEGYKAAKDALFQGGAVREGRVIQD